MSDKIELNLAGFTKGNGKSVHVIVNSNHIAGDYTLCSINTKTPKPMTPESQYFITDVNCAKCMRTLFYKENLELAKQEEEIEKKKPQNKKKNIVKKIAKSTPKKTSNKTKSKPESEVVPEPEPKVELETKVESPPSDTPSDVQIDVIDPSTNTTSTSPNEECLIMSDNDENISADQVASKIIELNNFITQIIYSINGQFYTKQRSDFKYRIFHKPSETIVFDEVGQDLIIQSLVSLNFIKTFWDGKHCMPKEFISEMRDAMKYSFLISGQTYPKCLDDKIKEHNLQPNRKKKTIIKIRKKQQIEIKTRNKLKIEEKIIIKRRIKQPIFIKTRNTN